MSQGTIEIQQKRGMRTAMGSAHWLTLTNHPSTEAAVQQLRRDGYVIYASDLNPKSIDIRDVEWDPQTDDHHDQQDDCAPDDGNSSSTSLTATATATNNQHHQQQQQQQQHQPPIC